jgi:trehalose 6-phosphate synthase
VLAAPVGIEPDAFARLARTAVLSPEPARLKASVANRSLIIGVDRLDYTKGIPGRFAAIEVLLSQNPELRRSFTYLQITPHSRSEVLRYQNLKSELEALAGRINGQFAEYDWTPIRYVNRPCARSTLAGFYRLARAALVTPFRDGMNLVAKEFVAAQDPDDPGVLILSRFAGAARELEGALSVNPLDREEMAAALATALAMPLTERQARWSAMFATLRRNSGEAWRRRLMGALMHTRPPWPSCATHAGQTEGLEI